MPTEAAFFFAGLLFIAAALGYVFARLGQLDDEDFEHGAARYLRGLRFLLEEPPERMLDGLGPGAELDGESLETHFALGQLFRRRGELDRAIQIHRDLAQRPRLPPEQRERAEFALAEDYLGAGLFDRAETLLGELRSSSSHQVLALRRLIRLAELTREWKRGIELQDELERLDPAAARDGRMVQYLCELAEQARQEGQAADAGDWLRQAAELRPESVRVLWLQGSMAAADSDFSAAARYYRRAAEREPSLLSDLLPQLSAVCKAGGLEKELSTFLADFCGRGSFAMRAVAFATMLEPAIDDPHALACLKDYINADPVLHALAGEEAGSSLARMRKALHCMACSGYSYRCLECGYSSAGLRWRCPGCGAWDSVRPRMRLAFDPEER